jgi:hypothetical protein
MSAGCRSDRFAAAAWFAVALVAAGCEAASRPRFAPASDAAAWKLLARETPALPLWARTTIESLPVATALQVDLDAMHRTQNPLGAELGARIRWAVADANRCSYAMESAERDVAGAGRAPDGPERSAVAFARRLTLAASSIGDEEVAQLVTAFGPDDFVAIVQTAAYANFQDRLFLALGLTSEPGGATPPRRTHVAPDAEVEVPERSAPDERNAPRDAGRDGAGPWSARTAQELRGLLEQKRSCAPRVPEPDAARLARLPRPERERVARTTLGRFARGYQPAFAVAWSDAAHAFVREANLDEVLANSVFWVVTRANDCFY